MTVLVVGVPDHRGDPSQVQGVLDAVAAIRDSQKIEPKWVGAFTPIAFWSEQFNAMSWRPLVVVAAGRRVAMSQRTDGKWDTALLERWWVRWMAITPPMTGWPKRTQRHFVYAMDDEGLAVEFEFASAVEARILATGMNEAAVGQSQSMATMPLAPQLRLFRKRPKTARSA